MKQAASQFKQPLVHTNKAIAALLAQVERHNRLLRLAKAALPQALSKQIVQCVVSGNKLLIYTPAASWASQIRFYKSAILKAIASETHQSIEMLQVRICAPILQKHEKPGYQAKVPKLETIKALRELIVEDADDALNKALLKLSATLERLSQ